MSFVDIAIFSNMEENDNEVETSTRDRVIILLNFLFTTDNFVPVVFFNSNLLTLSYLIKLIMPNVQSGILPYDIVNFWTDKFKNF